MTQDQQQKKAADRDPNREHMTLSELWQLWRDNLMSWRSFCDEHHDLFTLNIQAGFRRIGRWLSDLRSNARALRPPTATGGSPNPNTAQPSCSSSSAAAWSAGPPPYARASPTGARH